VTGASSGLGREFALALVARGYPVLAVARRTERLNALVDDVARRGGLLEPFVADLSTADGVEALLATAGEREVELPRWPRPRRSANAISCDSTWKRSSR